MHYVLAFITSYVYVGLKSLQQLNVVHQKYRWILPVSMMMAICEVYVVSSVAQNGWGWIVLSVGAGGGIGSITATWLHAKYLKGERC
jgi:hypothetical protein